MRSNHLYTGPGILEGCWMSQVKLHGHSVVEVIKTWLLSRSGYSVNNF